MSELVAVMCMTARVGAERLHAVSATLHAVSATLHAVSATLHAVSATLHTVSATLPSRLLTCPGLLLQDVNTRALGCLFSCCTGNFLGASIPQ